VRPLSRIMKTSAEARLPMINIKATTITSFTTRLLLKPEIVGFGSLAR
jgi:hypothetical protein